jgi:hypothetical protein
MNDAYAYERALGYAWYRDIESAAADEKLADIAAIPDRLANYTDMDMTGADAAVGGRRYRAACQASAGLALILGSAHVWIVAAAFAVVAIATSIGWIGFIFYVEGHQYGTRHATAVAIRLLRLRDVPLEEVGPESWTPWPIAPEGHGHLYAIRFSTGVVKVGQTNHPSRRMAEHRRDAWAYGVVITNMWISRAHATYLPNEVRLIAFAAHKAERSRREYFHGVDWDEVITFGDELTEGSVEGSRT